MRSFLPWALLLLFARGAIMLSLGDAFFYGEELEKATAGKAMLDDLGIPHHQLAYHYYEGGGFVISHVKALAFLVMGESLLANKVVALLSCLAVLGAGWWACGQAFGRPAAHCFAALYVFGPAAVQKLSLISLGIHHEACVFILLSLGLAASLMEQQRTRSWLLLGLCLGFGTYFSWVVALAAATCAIALLARWRGELEPGGVFAGVAGFLLGATPLLLMYAEVGGAVLDIHGTGLADASSASASESLRDFLRSIYLEDALGGVLGAIAYPAMVIWALLMGRRHRGEARPGWARAFNAFALFLCVFIAAYLMSAFVQGRVYHFFLMLRLVPLWIAGTVLIAAVMGRYFEEDQRSGPSPLFGAALVCLGIFGTFQVISQGRPSELLRNLDSLRMERGYIYSTYFEKLLPHLEGGQEEKLRVLLRFHEEDAQLLREEIASTLFRRRAETLEADFMGAAELVRAVDPNRFNEYLRGLGPLLVDWHGADILGCLELLQAAGADSALLSEALGRTGSGVHPRGDDLTIEGVEALLLGDISLVLGKPGAEDFSRGVGWRLHRVLHRIVYQPWRAEAFLSATPQELRASVRHGYVEARARGYLAREA